MEDNTMFRKMFETFGDDPEFRAMINELVSDGVYKISNDVKFGELEIDDELTIVTVPIVLEEHSFAFLNALNFAMNGKDETAFGNIADFIGKLQSMYTLALQIKERELAKKGE